MRKIYKSSSVILVGTAVSFINFWIWRIMNTNLVFGLTLILLSIIFIYLILIKFDKKFFLISLFLIVLISYQLLISGFDKNLIVLNPDQEKQINERHGYFSINLGKFFQNKFVLRFYKDVYLYLNVYESNIFNSLSPNLYFFANHPREREKVEEFSMYPSILVIPFLIGVIYLPNSLKYLIVGYILFALFVTGFIKQNYIFGPVMFFPLINLLISAGILKIYNFLLKK